MIQELITTTRMSEADALSCSCSCSCSSKTFSSGKKKAKDYAVQNTTCACACPSGTAKSNMKSARDSIKSADVAREVMEEIEIFMSDPDGEITAVEF